MSVTSNPRLARRRSERRNKAAWQIRQRRAAIAFALADK